MRALSGLVDAQQCGAGIDLAVKGGKDFTNTSRGWGAHGGLHLHAFQHHERVARLDDVTDRHRQSDDDRGGRGADDAGLVRVDAVTHTVHFHEQPGGVRQRDDVEAVAAKDEAALEFAEPFYIHHELVVVVGDAVSIRADLRHGQLVVLVGVAEFDATTDRVAGARTTTMRGGEKRGAFVTFLGVVGVDRGCDERDIGGRSGAGPRRCGAGAVDRAGANRTRDVFEGKQIEQERLVGRAAVNDHGGVAQRGAQPRQNLASVAAPRDDLGHGRVVIGRKDVALRDAGVDAHAGAEREVQQPHGSGRARRTYKTAVGVLRVEPGLHRVTELEGQSVSKDAPAATRICSFTRSMPVVISVMGCVRLQAGVDIQERENLLIRLIEVFDGARAAVSGGADEFDRHAANVVDLGVGQQRRTGFLDHL